MLITKTIADVEQTIKEANNVDLSREGEQILNDLATLKDDMENNRPLWYHPYANAVGLYVGPSRRTINQTLQDIMKSFLACSVLPGIMFRGSIPSATYTGIFYLKSRLILRLLHSMFASTLHWRHYDPFLRQKDEAFRSSKKGVLELAERFREFALNIGTHSKTDDPDQQKLLFVRRHQISESC